MLEFLSKYSGDIIVDKTVISHENIVDLISNSTGELTIKLIPDTMKHLEYTKYRFVVVDWMLKTASIEFDFMKKWNNNIPMPFKIMDGIILEETRGMYKVQLKASKTSIYCCKCGRLLTNQLSKLLKIGLECLFKTGLSINYLKYDQKDIDEASKKLDKIMWTGWIPKSGIVSIEEIKEDIK